MLFLQIKSKTFILRQLAITRKIQFSGNPGATHNYLHHETEPFQVLLVHWRNNKQLLTVEKAEPASSPHSGKAPPWCQTVNWVPGFLSNLRQKEKNYMTLESTERAKSKQQPGSLFCFCISCIPAHADKSLTAVLTSCLGRQKGETAEAVTESSSTEGLMKSHFLCRQRQDQMTIFGDILIHENISSLKTGTGNPKQLFNTLGTVL